MAKSIKGLTPETAVLRNAGSNTSMFIKTATYLITNQKTRYLEVSI